MEVRLLNYPQPEDWLGVKERALVTVGRSAGDEIPSFEWQRSILRARHSPIRYLRFSFYLEGIPSWVSVHLCRHVHAQPYVQSQRNDRQSGYDRNAAQQNAPVNMIWDINAEELQVVANKRLCMKASPETRAVVREMCWLVEKACPEFKGFLVPMCEYHGDICHEMKSCGRCRKGGD